jgi:hypothetical protein
LLDMAVEDDVVQDPAHVVFIVSKHCYNTKPTVILHFSMPGVFWLWSTVCNPVSQQYMVPRVCRKWSIPFSL